MTMLAARELEFLASLRTSWRELYLIEIARLMKLDDAQTRTANQASPQAPYSLFVDGIGCPTVSAIRRTDRRRPP